jgi:hypothetical protein
VTCASPRFNTVSETGLGSQLVRHTFAAIVGPESDVGAQDGSGAAHEVLEVLPADAKGELQKGDERVSLSGTTLTASPGDDHEHSRCRQRALHACRLHLLHPTAGRQSWACPNDAGREECSQAEASETSRER